MGVEGDVWSSLNVCLERWTLVHHIIESRTREHCKYVQWDNPCNPCKIYNP